MRKYLPVLVPVTFYGLLAFTMYNFNQPLWILMLFLQPRLDSKYVTVIEGKKAVTTVGTDERITGEMKFKKEIEDLK